MTNSTRPTGALFGLPAYFSDKLGIAATGSETRMGLGQLLFALTFIGLGILGLVSGKFAEVWQEVPKWLPAQVPLAYLCAALMLACGTGLLWRPTVTLAARVLFVYMLLWVVLLKIPPIVEYPLIEAQWASAGEIVVVLAGAWTLFALNAGTWDKAKLGFATGVDGLRIARLLLVIALIFVGLEHIIYAAPTADYVPAWIPYHLFWAYLVGAGHIAAGLGILFGVYPRLAAMLESQMMNVFTLLVWVPGFLKPQNHFQWTGFFISNALAFGMWVVADSYRGTGWLSVGGKASKN